MAETDVTLQGIQFEIRNETKQAKTGLNELTAALKNLQKTATKNTSLREFADDLKRLNEQLQSDVGKGLSDVASAISSFTASSKDLSKVASTLSRISKLDFSNLKNASDAINGIASAAGVAAGKTPAGAMKLDNEETPSEQVDVNTSVSGWETLIDRVRSFASVLKTCETPMSIVADGVKGFVKLAGKPFSDLTKRVKETLAPLSKFMSSIGRIAMYRVIRSMISGITKALKEGIGNLNEYSKLVGTEFHLSLNQIATDALYVKNSLATIVEPIVNAIAPAIDMIADKIAALSARVAELLASLSGKGTYTKAIKYATEYGDSVGKAAKEVRTLISGFDELNLLNDSSNGSGSDLDFGKMFETVEVNTDNLDFGKTFRDAIENADWAGIGHLLADKLNSIINGTDTLTFAKNIGTKISNAIRAGVEFLREVNLPDVGTKLSDIFNGLFETIDFRGFGELLSHMLTALPSVMISFLETLNWASVGTAIGEFLKGMLNGLSKWIDEVDWKKLGGDVFDGLIELIRSINVAEVIGDFGRLLGSVFEGAGRFLAGLWERFKEWVKDLFGGISSKEFSAGAYSAGNVGMTASQIAVHSKAGYDTENMLKKLAMLDDIDGYAAGGYPGAGDLFIANERGPELVGTMNGRTYVGSNQDINSVGRNLENAVYAAANMMIEAIRNKDLNISLDGEDLTRKITGRQNLNALARG